MSILSVFARYRAPAKTAPILRIPDDILLNILHNFGPRTLVISLHSSCPQDILAGVMSVCRKWRTLVKLSPTLWSDIAVYLAPRHDADDVTKKTFGPMLKRAEFLLERSQEAPLRLRLDLGAVEVDDLTMLRLFLDHAERWKDVQLNIDARNYGYLAAALKADGPTFDALTSLSIKLPPRRTGLIDETQLSTCAADTVTFLHQVPRSTSISLQADSHYARVIAQMAPAIFSRIHELFLDPYDSSHFGCLTMFQSLPAGAQVRLHGYRAAVLGSPGSDSETTTNIEELYIQSETMDERAFARAVLARLRTPQLRRLSVKLPRWSSINDHSRNRFSEPQKQRTITDIARFLSMSSTTGLTHLRLDNPFLEAGAFVEALSTLLADDRLASLRHLDLDLKKMNAQTAVLGVFGATPLVVPELRWLALRGCPYIKTVSIAAIRDQRLGTLEQICLDEGTIVVQSAAGQLQAGAGGGFSVTFLSR